MSRKSIRAMFYLLTPSETYAEHIEDVPDYLLRVSSTEKKTFEDVIYFKSYRRMNSSSFFKFLKH